ncbi:hypothetical protein [Cellulomonas oligotrophica]|uniref:Uncharacterized protein n=1 Tax=Cellulomonas oligotrophica TaxID=931536 RepID=A0A7Y9FFD3_9CELL|nr:hypothetical protein [Cellulomonas oligotrophica]NYD86128.1 hypothetical protein [Cellulomonas oligotrophica]GIG30864.1 hypothetical protein Col01nite_00230 [Cellulomonas oligotrophica]
MRPRRTAALAVAAVAAGLAVAIGASAPGHPGRADPTWVAPEAAPGTVVSIDVRRVLGPDDLLLRAGSAQIEQTPYGEGAVLVRTLRDPAAVAALAEELLTAEPLDTGGAVYDMPAPEVDVVLRGADGAQVARFGHWPEGRITGVDGVNSSWVDEGGTLLATDVALPS